MVLHLFVILYEYFTCFVNIFPEFSFCLINSIKHFNRFRNIVENVFENCSPKYVNSFSVLPEVFAFSQTG